MKSTSVVLAAVLAGSALCAHAAAVTYAIDPAHTYPSFEADHMGVSVWRGEFDKSSGTGTLDPAAATGSVDIQIDPNSVDYGLETMNKAARSDELFDTAKYPKPSF